MENYNVAGFDQINRIWVTLKSISGLLILILILNGCAARTPKPVPSKIIPAPKTKAFGKFQCDREADKAMEKGDIETGLHKHARFVTKHPDNPLAHYHLGYAFGQIRNIKQEIAHYEKAVSLGYIYNDQLYFNLAMAQAELGRYDQAITSFKKALAIKPNAFDSLLELSNIYRHIGDAQNERRILMRCLKLEPDNETIKTRLESLPED
jgi:tetratricopeptide (TPR) repeat protein